MNIFEISTRHEGFEHLLEFLFGPKGPFSATEVSKRMEKVRLTRSIDSRDEDEGVVQQAENMPNVINGNFKTPKVQIHCTYSTFQSFNLSLNYHLPCLEL